MIEVFIHDPLYKWALTTTAANRRQHEGAGGDEVGVWSGWGALRCACTAQRSMAGNLRARECMVGARACMHACMMASCALLQDGEDAGAQAGGAAAGGVNLANADAERTLLRIKQKLEGVEAGGWGWLAGRQAGSWLGWSSAVLCCATLARRGRLVLQDGNTHLP